MWDFVADLFSILYNVGEVAAYWPIKSAGPLKIHNTLSGKLEEFSPLSNREVKMYNCGPTVYDRQHIGNMFAAVLPDLLRRSLEAWGYKVKQVINITDFGHLVSDADEGEDKMTKGLQREGLALTMENMSTLAEKYTALYLDDIAALGVPTKKIVFPRASHYIPEMIALIKALEQKGYAYKTSDGVYFDTKKFPEYGKLGNINLAGQEAGARVETNPEKKNATDFALWKFQPTGDTKKEKLGWESPWGTGFPGWHIECTAMIFKLLGKQIDIHTGGIEHIPVHHNNEIAQAESLTGKQYVKYWLHNAHITIEGKKISKSLGNTVYLSQITDRGYSPRAFRYWVLTGHYRTPMNFTWEAIEGADQAFKRLTRSYLEAPKTWKEEDKKFLEAFYTAIGNDLNTAQALAVVWENIGKLDQETLRKVDQMLGLGFTDPQAQAKLKVLAQGDLPAEVQKLVTERTEARSSKDFARSDTLRTQIEEAGYSIKDSPDGQQITKR